MKVIHLGPVGLVANLRYMEIVDFFLGFATIDIAGDDGKKLGTWPWRNEATPKEKTTSQMQ